MLEGKCTPPACKHRRSSSWDRHCLRKTDYWAVTIQHEINEGKGRVLWTLEGASSSPSDGKVFQAWQQQSRNNWVWLESEVLGRGNYEGWDWSVDKSVWDKGSEMSPVSPHSLTRQRTQAHWPVSQGLTPSAHTYTSSHPRALFYSCNGYAEKTEEERNCKE